MAEATPKKPSNQQLFVMFSNLMNGHPATLAFGMPPFPTKFHVIEPECGERLVAIELPGRVLLHVKENAVLCAIVSYGANLDEGFHHYKWDVRKARDALNYWLAHTEPLKEDVRPVLQKDTPGYCWRRLDFNLADEPTPVFDKFLSWIKTNPEGFLAFTGALFDPHAPRQQYLWLHGEGEDGKGTWMRFLRKILGDAYVALYSDTKKVNQFFSSRLLGKRLGVFPDCKNLGFVTDELFMSLSGEDAVAVEKKNKDGYTADLQAMYMFSANALPRISSQKSDQRRAITCEFIRAEEDFIEDLESKLWAERAGILHKCFAAWLVAKSANKNKIPVDRSVAAEIAEKNEEVFQGAFAKLLRNNEKGSVTPFELAQALHKEGMHDFEIQRFKAWMERTHKIKSKRPDNFKPRAYFGVSLKNTSGPNTEAPSPGDSEIPM